LFWKMPGVPSGLDDANGAQSIMVLKLPMPAPLSVTASCVYSYSSPPAAEPWPLTITVTCPLTSPPVRMKLPAMGTVVALKSLNPVKVTLGPPATSGLVDTKSSEYLKPMAANSGVTPAPSHGSPVYGLEPPPMPIQMSCAPSERLAANGARSALG